MQSRGTALELKENPVGYLDYKVRTVLYEFMPELRYGGEKRTRHVLFCFVAPNSVMAYPCSKVGQIHNWELLSEAETIQEIINEFGYCVIKC